MGLPSASVNQLGSTFAPTRLASTALLPAMPLVAASKRKGASSLAGAAMAMGFVPTLGSAPKVGSSPMPPAVMVAPTMSSLAASMAWWPMASE